MPIKVIIHSSGEFAAGAGKDVSAAVRNALKKIMPTRPDDELGLGEPLGDPTNPDGGKWVLLVPGGFAPSGEWIKCELLTSKQLSNVR